MATAEFSKFAGILSAALSQHHLSGFEITHWNSITFTRPFRYDLNKIPYDYTVEVRNRFKGLDLMDRVPEELWMEVVTLYRRKRSRPSPRKRNAKNWSKEALQIAVKRREVKSKGEKERYKHLMQSSKE